jgi:acetoin utilization protein AcuB
MLRVRDSMTREVVTLGPESSAAEAWGVCQELGIRHLPIIEGGGVWWGWSQTGTSGI